MAAKPTSAAATPPAISQKLQPQKQTAVEQQEKRIEEVLSYPILLSDQINGAVKEADIFKLECSEVGKQVERLCQMLRSAVRLATSTATFYVRPLRRIATEVSKNLEKSLTLVKKCRRRNPLRRVVTIVSSADFKKLHNLLDSSVADMKWVLSIYEAGGAGGIVLTLPPIASNDPMISWVWSFVSSLYMGQLQDKAEAANEIASLAKDNDRNKQIIVEEGGIPPLLKLLKDSSSPEGQAAAASALYNLANDVERVRAIIDESGVPIIVQVLGDSPMKVQIKVANLVAKMAEHCPLAQEDFARENVIRPLVTLLSIDLLMDDAKLKFGKQSIHSIVEIRKEMEKKSLYKPGLGPSLSMHYSEGSGKGGNHKKDRENEKPEVKHGLKMSCAEALWMLAKGNVANSKRITETKGLLSLAKLVETEQGELQYNCLMTIMEITSAAESNADLRRATFKTNSPASKAVVDQLLRVIKESDESQLRIAAITAIGCLARAFPAREIRVIGPLVEQLGHRSEEVATEAAIALGKFACPDNFLCVEHSKTIIEFRGVQPLMRLLKGSERAQLHGLILICYLAIHAGKSDDLERAGVVKAFEGVDRAFVAQHPELKELITQALYHLSVFHQSHSGMLAQRPFLAP
ncbi:armadillo repeat only 4 [Perilla frutescens var. hirtella]|uniref:Armadillo repeat only 4 n=1 Tax=Perilla frutescens var. hirtella TaxID=608512 RepID=A0AAD4P5U8_PERFH|nr:armadillo repeat only 4 [Perilla frutescens var. hirtella]KAH6828038.1 armadillo repeat only 4 [Perilla frutescens var. hirtella]